MQLLLWISLLTSVLLVNGQPNDTLPTFCGGAGYDVSSLIGYELSYITPGSWWWFVAPCGRITSDANCTNPVEAPYGSMICQRSADGTSVYVIATYNRTVAQYGTQWLAEPNGVSMRTQGGDRCAVVGDTFREATIYFVCNNTAIIPWLERVTEPETCWYTAYIHTTAACTTIGPTMSNQVGSSFYSTQCGGGIFDLSTLSTQDLYYNGFNYDYWVRLCAYVSEPQCASAQPTSFCQKRFSPTVGTPVDVSDWNNSVPNIYTITAYGMTIDIKSGAGCAGNGPRQATYYLYCNRKVTRPTLSYVWEAPICWYHAIIQTPAVCTGNNDPSQGYCGGGGYDLTGLSTLDLTLSTNDYDYYLHPCSTLSPWYTGACSGRSSMFCQVSKTSGFNWNLAKWNASIAASATWMAITNGVQLYIQYGDLCPAASNLPRDTAILFICNETAMVPWFASVSEPETCFYQAVIHTEFACDLVAPTAPHLPGYTYLDTTCGGGYWDLSDIRDEANDLWFDTNPGVNGSGWIYYLELCGQVSAPRCNPLQPTMLCQVSKHEPPEQFSIAAYNESELVAYTINTNGVTMEMQTGTPCGSIPRRALSVTVVCDGTLPAVITSVREIEICHYSVIVHGRCELGSTEPFSSTRPGLPSSSSTARPSSSSSSSIRSSSSSTSLTSSRSSSSSSATSSMTPQQSSSSSSSSDPSTALPSTSVFGNENVTASSKSSLSDGAIAGIVIGSVIGAFLILCVLVAVCCGLGRGKSTNFKEMKEQPEESQVTQHEGESGEVELETR